jgi:hypothetical protein
MTTAAGSEVSQPDEPPAVAAAVGRWLLARVRDLRAVGFGLLAIAGAQRLGDLIAWLQPPYVLGKLDPPLHLVCGVDGRTPLQAASLYATESRWVALFVLLSVVAAGALVAAAVALAATGLERPEKSAPRAPIVISTVCVAAIGVAAAAIHLYRLSGHDPGLHGFLTHMLDAITGHKGCAGLRDRVWPTRLIGEGAAIVVGAAMVATAGPLSDARTAAARIQRLQLLLYCGSFLFVAGIMMSESNVNLIVAQWASPDGSDDKLPKALAEVIKSGTVQAGVGYSALLAMFFLPARAYLAWRARGLAREARDQADGAAANLPDHAGEKKSLQDAGLMGSWRDDLKQILALLAPILSAPLFDALAKK